MSPQIEDMEKMMRDVPAMPVVAQKVMQLMGDPRSTNSLLGETLSADQALVARILQMANSPFFATRQKIASISNAIFILGHSALRSLLITVCTKDLFKGAGLMEEKLWEHALGAAVAAKEIALKTGMQAPDEAFIAGLLHDIGKTCFVVVFHGDYKNIFSKAYNEKLSMGEVLEMEKEEFGYNHCEVGARAIAKWRLPKVYARAARRHHADSVELIQKEDEPNAIALVGQANLIAARVGLGQHEPDKRIDVIATVYNEILGLDRDAVLQIIEKTLKIYKDTRSQFNLT